VRVLAESEAAGTEDKQKNNVSGHDDLLCGVLIQDQE